MSLFLNSLKLSLVLVMGLLVTAMNITIDGPNGTRQYGNTICLPAKWYQIIIFFCLNYVAHAATVRTLPGERKRFVFFNYLVALCLPYSGVWRGVEAIARAVISKDDLDKATQAGALGAVVRTKGWEPRDGDKIDNVRVKMNGNLEIDDNKDDVEVEEREVSDDREVEHEPRRTNTSAATRDSPDINIGLASVTATLPEDFTAESANTSPFVDVEKGRRVAGRLVLPPGYRVALVPSNALVEFTTQQTNVVSENGITKLSPISQQTTSLSSPEPSSPIGGQSPPASSVEGQPAAATRGEEHLSSANNVPKAMIAIVQTLYASYTLYKARAVQFNVYGYAAFGLTVLPYVIMSIVNLVANIATPTYPTICLVRSLEMYEAERHGGEFDGVLGILVQNLREDKSSIFRRVGHDWCFGTRPSTVFEENHDREDIPRQRRAEDSPTDQFTPITCRINTGTQEANTGNVRSTIEIPACTEFKKTGTPRKRNQFCLIICCILIAVPFVVIGVLTSFERGSESTISQRGWTMAWLVNGCVWGVLVPSLPRSLLGDLVPNRVISAFDLEAAPQGVRRANESLKGHWNILRYVLIAAFFVPAGGGFYTVGKMLQDFGVCTTF